MKKLEIYQCGTIVKIKNAGFIGDITGVNIRMYNIMYEISYYMNNNYYAHWFYEHQLEFEPDAGKVEIGFRRGKINE